MVTCHTSVTLDDIVIVIVTSHEIIEEKVEGSRRMICMDYSSLVYKVDNLV